MLVELEDDAAVGALALEDAAAIVEAMGEHVNRRILPRHEFAVVPDDAGAIVEGLGRHGPYLLLGRSLVFAGSCAGGRPFLRRAPFVDMVPATSCHREGAA